MQVKIAAHFDMFGESVSETIEYLASLQNTNFNYNHGSPSTEKSYSEEK